MLFKKIKTEVTFVLITLFCIGGCSTFEKNTVYVEQEQKSKSIFYKNSIADLSIQFNPDHNFGSVGILGLPVIPLYIKLSKTDDIVLTMEVRTYQPKFFSASVKPCLQTNYNEKICPDHLNVSAIGMQDVGSVNLGEHSWEHVCSFGDRQDINIDVANVSPEDKVDRTRILKHYDCKEESVDYLTVEYAYTYKCNGECPAKIILNPKDLIYVDSLTVEDHNYIFERTVDKDYRPIVVVQ